MKKNRNILSITGCSLLLTPAFMLSLHAGTYQWNGSADSDWNNPANWNAAGVPAGITGGIGPSGVSAAHRLNVNNGAANPLIYSSAQGNTTYANAPTNRGVVIGSGASGAGRFIITGGTFSTAGSGGADVIGNVTGATLPSGLTVDGGDFIGNSLGMIVNFGGTNNVCDVTVQSGSATFATLTFGGGVGQTSGSSLLDLQGGITSVNNIARLGTAPGSVKFAGGTLKARVATTTFIQGLTEASITAAGGTIDTNGVNVTMSQPLVNDVTTSGGTFTKAGAGTLTANGTHTFTGPVSVIGGKFAVTAPLSSTTATVAAGATLRVATGTAAWAPNQLSLTGNLELDLGVYNAANPLPITPVTLDLAGPVTLNVGGSGMPVGIITLLTYTTKTGSGSFTLGTLPPGASGTLVDTGTAVELHLTTPSVQELTWSFAGGTWQTGGGLLWNGNTLAYQEYGAFGDLVSFTDAAAGTVDITGLVKPIAMTITNTTPYIFQGTGSVSGNTALIKNGTSIATFNTADSFTGSTTVNAGAVIIGAANTTTGAVTVATNATYGLKGVTDGAGQTLTYTGPGVNAANIFFTGSAIQRGALQGVTGDNVWEGTVQFSGANARIGVQDGARLVVTGNIIESLPNSLLSIRGGTTGSDVTISGTGNNWTGGTDVFSGGGSIKAGGANVFPSTGLLRVGTTGITGTSVFDLNGFDQAAAGLGIIGGTAALVTNNGATAATLTLRPVFAAASFPGIISDGVSKLSIIKEGANTQTFTGLNTYTGNTTVTAGTLTITQPYLADAADVIVGNDGTLALNFAGTDTVNALTIAGVAKSPGNWGSADSGAQFIDTHLTGTGILQVTTGPPANAYDTWAATEDLSGAIALGTADPDNDGVLNLIEFVLGSSPTSSNPLTLPTASQTSTALVVRFPRTDASETASTLTIQVSDDLQSWPPALEVPVGAASDLTGTLPGGATVLITENAAAADEVEVTIPLGSATRKYARLRAVKP
jgi:fibronectin-binding autotransporter adhesin